MREVDIKMNKFKIVDAVMWMSSFYAVSYLMSKFSDLNATKYSFIYILVYIGIYYIFKFRGQCKKVLIENKILLSISVLLSLTIVTGIYFDSGLPFESMASMDFINYLICVIGLMPLCKCLFAGIFQYMYKYSSVESGREIKKGNDVAIFFAVFVIIFGCWMLVWLAYYPGLWNYDPYQVSQFLNKDYNKHHPLIHTILLGFCYSTGLQKNDCNSGVMLYDFIQMSLMCGIFAYTYVYIHRHISSKIFRGIALAFYAIFPVNSILAISSTKDVLFSGLVLLCMVLFVQVMELHMRWKKILLSVVLMVSCVIMMLFRNNAIYAFYIFIIFACVISVYRKNIFALKKVLMFSICCVALFQISDAVLTKTLDAKEGSIREMFSVPSQQFGRIYNLIYESGEDTHAVEIINSYYNMERSVYNPYLADSMKGTLNIANNENVMNYIKDAIVLFCKYPLISLDAFLYVTEGNWYINDISNSNIYGHGLENRQGYLLTDIKGGYNIIHKSKLPGVELFLEKSFSDNGYQHWPVLSILFSPALYFWVLVICTVVFIKAGRWELLMGAGFLWGLYLTILLGPCALIRYSYPLVTCSPFILCMANLSIKKTRNDICARSFM